MRERRSAVTFLLAAVAAGTLALAGCSGSDDDGTAAEGGGKPGGKSVAPSPSVSASASVDPSAAPGTAVTGTVSGGVHKGDLRYFLLPLPDGAQTYGDRTGDRASLEEAAIGLGADAAGDLKADGFQDGALRVYRTGDGRTEVNVKLLRFSSADGARAFAGRKLFDGPSVPIPGQSAARATRLDSSAAESTDALVAVSYEGDTAFTIGITSSTPPTAEEMADLLGRQHDHLRTGG